MTDLLASLHSSERTPFQAHRRTDQIWSCSPILTSYLCDVRKEMIFLQSSTGSLCAHPSSDGSPQQPQFKTCSVTELGLCSKWNKQETFFVHKEQILIAVSRAILLATFDQLTKMRINPMREYHYPHGLSFLNRTSLILMQVFQTCTPSSPSNRYTTSVV